MQTTEFANSNPYFANDYQLDRPKITRGKFRAFAFQRIVALLRMYETESCFPHVVLDLSSLYIIEIKWNTATVKKLCLGIRRKQLYLIE